ncbi:MAG: DUF5131 family protein, partial [Planctomycetota bacterium]|nr:DUF5131 family protein [Planctomycetota bacterium]
DWVLTGGESGWRARPMQLEWLRQAHHGARAARATIHFKQFGHARNNPLVTALKRDHGYSLQRAFAEACSSGLEKEPGEKGGATLDGEVLHEKPPAYYRIKDRLNQQPRSTLV